MERNTVQTTDNNNDDVVLRLNFMMQAWSCNGLKDHDRTVAWGVFLEKQNVELQEQSWGSYQEHLSKIQNLPSHVLSDIQKDIER